MILALFLFTYRMDALNPILLENIFMLKDILIIKNVCERLFDELVIMDCTAIFTMPLPSSKLNAHPAGPVKLV